MKQQENKDDKMKQQLRAGKKTEVRVSMKLAA